MGSYWGRSPPYAYSYRMTLEPWEPGYDDEYDRVRAEEQADTDAKNAQWILAWRKTELERSIRVQPESKQRRRPSSL